MRRVIAVTFAAYWALWGTGPVTASPDAGDQSRLVDAVVILSAQLDATSIRATTHAQRQAATVRALRAKAAATRKPPQSSS